MAEGHGGRSAGKTSWWKAVIEHPSRPKRQMRCSTSSWQKSHGFHPFNLPNVCWKYNTAERKQPRRFLECLEDNLLTQLVRESTGGGSLVDVLFVNRGLLGDVVVGWWQRDHKMSEFSIVCEVKRGTRTSTLDFGWANLGLV